MNDKMISEYLLNRFVWTRTNTIELFEFAQKSDILQYKPQYLIENPTENHNLLYQFQCIITSTDAHFRRVRNEENTKSGIYVKGGIITKKQDIEKENSVAILKEQIDEEKQLSVNYSDLRKLLSAFITIYEHEALHQGQLVVMFREKKVEFPQEFKRAWNL